MSTYTSRSCAPPPNFPHTFLTESSYYWREERYEYIIYEMRDGEKTKVMIERVVSVLAVCASHSKANKPTKPIYVITNDLF